MWVATTDKRIMAIELATGEKFWSRRFRTPLTGTPQVYEGTVFCKTSFPDGKVYALRASDGKVLWRKDAGDTTCNLAVCGGRVAYAAGTEIVFVNPQDGEEEGRVGCDERPTHLVASGVGGVLALTPAGKWGYYLPDQRKPKWVAEVGPGATPPVVADGTVWGLNGAGELVGVALSEGTVLSRANLKDVGVGTCFTAGGEIVVVGRRSILGVAPPGEVRWRVETGQNVIGAAPASDGAFVVFEDGEVGFVTLGLYQYVGKMRGAGVVAPAVEGGKVIVCDAQGNVYGYIYQSETDERVKKNNLTP